MSSRLLAAALFVATLIPLALACGSEDETKYGGPAGLSGRKVADPTGAAGTSSVGSPAPCNEAGASTEEGGTCTVSFQQTIFAKYMNGTTGTWKCANSNCHGPTGAAGVGVNAPTIDGTNAQAAYNALTQFNSLQGEAYINACTTDPSGSAIDCDLKGSC
ncbi:MAG: hypothetical protein ACRELY_03840, partial [Polyangiaceae bacterium]